jgi:hypothetical protein
MHDAGSLYVWVDKRANTNIQQHDRAAQSFA